MRFLLLLAIIISALHVLPSAALGQDCTFPDGNAGQIRYNSSEDVFQGCTPTGWQAFHGPDTLSNGLIGHWTLDDASGDFLDSSGYGNDGTNDGGVTYGERGVLRNAGLFDGTDDHIDIVESATDSLTNQMAVAAWVRIDGPNVSTTGEVDNVYPFVVQWNNANSFILRYDGDADKTGFNITGVGGACFNYRVDYTLDDGSWHHVVAIYDGTQQSIYINGKLIGAPCTQTGTINNGNRPVAIGRWHIGFIEGTIFHNGAIDDVRIYNRALSADEVAQLYTGTFHGWTDLTSAVAAGGTTINDVEIQGDKLVVVGDSGLVKTSDNRGQTWTDRTTAAGFGGGSVLRVGYAGSTIIAVTSGQSPGIVFKRSDDDGASWTDITADVGAVDGLRTRDLEYDGQTAAIVLSAGLGTGSEQLLVSTDDGVTWEDGTAPGAAHYSNVAVHGNTIITVGSNNHDDAQVSTNVGQSWTNSEIDNPRWYGLDYNGRLLVVAGTSATEGYLVSTDLGQNWTNRSTELGAASAVATMFAQDYLFAWDATMVKYSADDGATWTEITEAVDFGSSAISNFASDGDYVLVGGEDGKLKIAPVDCENPAGYLGMITYNTSHDAFQGCAPSGWYAFHTEVTGGASDACHPANVPAPGQVCTDGTVYAGLSPDGNVPMFTTPADAPGTYDWTDDNNGTSHPSVSSVQCSGGWETACETGQSNTATLVTTDSNDNESGVQPHLAAQYCADLDTPEHDDWYLPALLELEQLYDHRLSIGGFGAGRYWSSSQENGTNARNFDFGTGSQADNNKRFNLPIRCVRKGYAAPSDTCSNPDGRTGEVTYNTTDNVFQGCTAAGDWVAFGQIAP